MTHPVRVVAVVVDDSHVLLAYRQDTSRWDLPNTQLDPGEQIQVALRRGVEHLAGLVVTAERLSGICTRDGAAGLVFVFRARHVVGQLQTPDPLLCCQWVPINDAATLLNREQVEYLRLGTSAHSVRHPTLVHQLVHPNSCR